MNIGLAMKLARKQKGYSQTEVASLLGVSLNYVSMLENGHRAPSWSYVVKYADVLEFPLPKLVLLALPHHESVSVARTIANELLSMVDPDADSEDQERKDPS